MTARSLRPLPLGAGLLLAAVALSAAPPPGPSGGDPAAPQSGVLKSDYLEFRSSESVVVARGRAVLVSSSTRMEADEIRVHTASRTASAEGHVYLEDGGMSALAGRASYDWGASTGSLADAYLLDPPWRIWARRIDRLGPDRYRLRRVALTSCDQDPPHYHFRSAVGRYRAKKRATVYHAGLRLGDTPVLYTPVYTHSLKKRPWTLTVDPGQSAYHGVFAKSTLTYPFREGSYGKLYWDHFERTGDGVGAEYTYSTATMRGSLYGYRIEDRVAQREQWDVRIGHWQQLRPRWAFQTNIVYQNQADFNNLFDRNDLERVRQRAQSSAGLTYQNPLYSSRLSVEHDRLFDFARNRFVRQRTVAPQLSAQSSPLQWGKSGFYTTLSGSARNEYIRPQQNPLAADPLFPEQDRFRRAADGSVTFGKRLRLTRHITLEPAAGSSGQFQSFRPLPGGAIDPRDTLQGRGFTRVNWRQRLSRSLDYDLVHSYRVRWSPNTLKREHAGSGLLDKGLEDNSVGLFFSYLPDPRFWARASSGYDFRILEGETIETPRQKITPPSFELNARPTRNLALFFRQTFQLFPVRRPQTGQFGAEVAKSRDVRLSSGFSYNAATPGQLQVRHAASFYLTRGWWLDGGLQYRARGAGGLRYNAVQIDEKSLTVRRDLHCWVFRGLLQQRPGNYEVSFRIDLNANVQARERVTAGADEKQFYPGREDERR